MSDQSVGGNARRFFSDLLPNEFVPDILELVMSTWCSMRKPGRAREPRITALLKDALIIEIERRLEEDEDIPFLVFAERQITAPDSGRQVSRTDIEFYHRQLCIRGQQPYFIFESKRLNVDGKGKYKSNASEYVGSGGMMCFVTGKYSSGGSFCGMLGYVMDGDVAGAHRSVKDAISKKGQELKLVSDDGLIQSCLMPSHRYNGETHHRRGARGFSIFHLFLPL